MSPTKPSPQKIVSHVLEAWRTDTADDGVIEQLAQLGLSSDEASDALELVRSGIGRAALLSAGLSASNISSDVDDDPIFRAAVEAGRRNIASAPPEPPADPNTLAAQLTSDDVQARRTAAYELGRSKDRNAVARLLAALDDPDMYVRTYAIQSLKDLRAKEAVAPCCALLSSDAPQLVLVNAIKALADIRDPVAVPALIDATRHENAFIRHDAAWALGEFADARAIPALEALLADKAVPVERDKDGLPTQTSIYSVADHAQRSLDKIRRAVSRAAASSPKRDFILSFVWTAAGLIGLGLCMHAYTVHGDLWTFRIACSSLILLTGILGLVYRAKAAGAGRPIDRPPDA